MKYFMWLALFFVAAIFQVQGGVAWTPPVNFTLSPEGQIVSLYQDPVSGRAVVAWTDVDMHTLYASVYTPNTSGGSWTARDTLFTASSNNIQSLDAYINAAGEAGVMWANLDTNTSETTIFASFYNSAWSATPETIDVVPLDRLTSGCLVQITIDGQGTARALFTDISRHNLFYALRTVGWAVTPLDGPLTTTQYDFIQFSVNSSGQGVAAWFETDFVNSTPAAVYFDGTAWETITLFANINYSSFNVMQASIGSGGTAIATWAENLTNLFAASQNTPGGSWSSTLLLNTTSLITLSAPASINSFGNALLSYSLFDASNHADIKVVPYTIAGGWNTGATEIVASYDSAALVKPINNAVVLDDNGNAISVWVFCDGISDIYHLLASTKANGATSWDQSGDIFVEPETLIYPVPYVAINGDNLGIAVWGNTYNGQQFESTGAAVTLLPPPTPPSNLTAKVIKNKFLDHTEYVVDLHWTLSSDPTAVGYQIYRDGKLLTQLPVVRSYIDHTVHKHHTYEYTVVAINGSGLPSTPIAVTVKIK